MYGKGIIRSAAGSGFICTVGAKPAIVLVGLHTSSHLLGMQKETPGVWSMNIISGGMRKLAPPHAIPAQQQHRAKRAMNLLWSID